MKIFVAGATGAVGLPLVRALCTLGHQVTGMTRAGPGADHLREPTIARLLSPRSRRAAGPPIERDG